MNELKFENDYVSKKSGNIFFISIILFFVLSLVGLFAFLILDTNNKQNTKNENKKEQITPLMYEVTKEGSNNKIYLFGSMHMVNHDEFEYPKYILDAYNNSDYVACEFDVVEYTENMNATEMLADLMYTDGSTIKDHISEETYNKMVQFLKDKYMYNENLDIYNLYFFETMITQAVVNNSKLASGDAVDSYFLKKAKEDKKNILEVESYQYQINIFKSFQDRLYELEILDIIDNYDDSLKELEELYEAWKKGDISKFIEEDEIDEDKYSKEDIKILEDYNKKILDERNIGMTEKLISYFDNNYKTFYMVGAAHLVGDNGIANLLEQKGYKVTRIK